MTTRAALVCATPHGGAVVCCVVSCRVAVCCVVLCCVALRGVVVCGPPMVGCAALVFGLPHGRACRIGVRCVVLFGVVCCRGVWPRSWWGVVWWCVAPLMVGPCCVVLFFAALRCILSCCVALSCPGVVCGPPNGRACCLGVWPPARWGVLCWCSVLCCVALCVGSVCGPIMVEHAVFVCPPSWTGVVCCVVLRCNVLCCVALRRVVWWCCVAPLTGGRGVVVCGPFHGGAVLCCVVSLCVAVCCVVLRRVVWWWCVAPLMAGRAALGCDGLCCVALCVVVVFGPRMVGRAVLVCRPPLGWAYCVGVRCVVFCRVVLSVEVCDPRYAAACCVGVWPPSWLGCVALRSVVLCCVVLRVMLVCGPPRGGACCVGVWPPAWWGVLRWGAVSCVVWCCVLWWCVAPLMVGHGVVVCSPPRGGAVLRCVLLCCVAVRCVVLCRVVWRGGVWPHSWWGMLRRCVAPLHGGAWCVWVRCAVLPGVVLCVVVMCGPSHCGACCVEVRCVVLCGVVLCVVVYDLPYGGMCRIGVWSPSWWGCVALCCVVGRWVCCAVWRCAVCGAGVWSPSWWGVPTLVCGIAVSNGIRKGVRYANYGSKNTQLETSNRGMWSEFEVVVGQVGDLTARVDEFNGEEFFRHFPINEIARPQLDLIPQTALDALLSCEAKVQIALESFVVSPEAFWSMFEGCFSSLSLSPCDEVSDLTIGRNRDSLTTFPPVLTILFRLSKDEEDVSSWSEWKGDDGTPHEAVEVSHTSSSSAYHDSLGVDASGKEPVMTGAGDNSPMVSVPRVVHNLPPQLGDSQFSRVHPVFEAMASGKSEFFRRDPIRDVPVKKIFF